jgi:hypothetical protein
VGSKGDILMDKQLVAAYGRTGSPSKGFNPFTQRLDQPPGPTGSGHIRIIYADQVFHTHFLFGNIWLFYSYIKIYISNIAYIHYVLTINNFMSIRFLAREQIKTGGIIKNCAVNMKLLTARCIVNV